MVMQAIHTKYLAPTNNRGSRIVARYQGGKITVGWDYSKSIDENHLATALQLAEKLDWLSNTSWTHGCLPDGSFCLAFRPKEGGAQDD